MKASSDPSASSLREARAPVRGGLSPRASRLALTRPAPHGALHSSVRPIRPSTWSRQLEPPSLSRGWQLGIILATCVGGPACRRPQHPGYRGPVWGPLRACTAVHNAALARDEAQRNARADAHEGGPDDWSRGLHGWVSCYERTQRSAACLHVDDQWLLPALRAHQHGEPICARGPFRPTEESPTADRLCCYSLMSDGGE